MAPHRKTHSRSTSSRARPRLLAFESRIAPAVFTVLNTNDAGAGSFRQAILDANANAGPDIINFDAGTFSTPQTISLTTVAQTGSMLGIGDSVTINGPGAGLLTVRRDASAATGRVFLIGANDGLIQDITIAGMTISGGQVSGSGNGGRGAAMFINQERVTLRDCVVTGNAASSGAVAGTIYTVLNVVNSTITGNTATGSGGGIRMGYYNDLTVLNSTIANNSAGGNGGGLYFRYGGTLVMENSTVSGNNATRGAGLYFYDRALGQGLIIRNSTIANNIASAEGGGIALAEAIGPLIIQNSTVTGNSGTTGGGIARIGTSTSSIYLAGTVVANNTAGTGPDISSTGTVNGNFSLVRNQTGFTLTGANNLPANTDPLFAVAGLANNGGPVQTVALQPGSPLINAGANAALRGSDARGVGFSRNVGQTDIGAYEFSATVTPSAAASGPDVTSNGGTTYQFTVAYGANINTATLGNDDVTVTGPFGFTQNANFVSSTTSGTTTTAIYSITAPGGAFDAADYGTYTVAVNVAAVSNLSGTAVPAGPAGTFKVLTPTTFVVANTADAGPGSLRQAILDANARIGSADTITFQAGVTGTITLATGQLDISDPVTVTGPGAVNLTISGNNASRVMRIFIPGGVGVANISGLTLTGGNANADTNSGIGGGVFISNDNVTLDGVVVSGSTTNSGGGGIGVQSGGRLTVRNSTISGNTVTAGGSGYYGGGGIYFYSGGSLLLENSTVSGNSSVGEGGGIYFFGLAVPGVGGLTVRNSTIAGNTSASGGGIGLDTFTGDLRIQNSTIALNSAGTGGGVARLGGAGSITISSTVIANNTATTANPDFSGPVTADHSLIRDQTGTTFTDAGGNLAAGTNPLFAAAGLSNNGGPQQTIALQSTSPLINAGSNPAGLTGDERGAVGFFRTFGANPDIGAFEFQAPLATVVNDGSVQRSRVTSLTVTFAAPATFATTAGAAFTLTRVSDGAVVTFTATATTVNGVTQVVLNGFSGTAANFGSLADGRYTLTALSNQITIGGLALDGDGNGTPGGNYVFGDAQGLYRFFGDINGDRHVDIADFGLFSSTFSLGAGQPGFIAAFDFNGDGHIDIADLGQFSLRFFTVLP